MGSAPFRWDLVTPDQLGTLLDSAPEPDLWFMDELIDCAAKVVARSGNGDLIFVGRSLDSMFDLLGGVFSGLDVRPQLSRLPVSLWKEWMEVDGRYVERPWSPEQVAHLRALLSDVGVTPAALMRRSRPMTFVDVVSQGQTFTHLYEALRSWIEEDRAQWDIVRRKIRFIAVTRRKKTSPNTDRWWQDVDWPRELPADSVTSVSLDVLVWQHLADYQIKLTRSHRPSRWLADGEGPGRDERTRAALAEAVAIVALGRSRSVRDAVVLAARNEPSMRESWLRTLLSAVRR